MFQVIEGRLSPRYNHFADHVFESCVATDTRLMGVTALKITWKGRTRKDGRFYQLIHLDFSEYGIDDYAEYCTSPEMEDYSRIISMQDLQDEWERISGCLGGSEVRIPLEYAMALIDQALAINEQHFRHHDEEIREFRKETLERIDLMRTQAPASADPVEAMRAVIPKKLTACETINYFLMRLCDQDFAAAALLTDLSVEEMEALPIAGHGIMTLTRNRISRARGAALLSNTGLYHCTLVTEYDHTVGYRYFRASVTLETSSGWKFSKVTGCTVDVDQPLSDFEAAMQLKQPEYITVYEIEGTAEEFDLDMLPMSSRCACLLAPNGTVWMRYNIDNAHVDTNDYYMNHDLYGAYLVTMRGQLVIMSSEIVKISMMEMELATAFFSGEVRLTGRYRFDTQVFQSFAQMPDTLFEDIIK